MFILDYIHLYILQITHFVICLLTIANYYPICIRNYHSRIDKSISTGIALNNRLLMVNISVLLKKRIINYDVVNVLLIDCYHKLMELFYFPNIYI
jgi:hypothetical protein